MILYVNGDSHTAAAEAVNAHAFAEDDPNLVYLGRLPHPDNLAVSWGRVLSTNLKAVFRCDAESAASNDRIIRTTKQWIADHEKELYRTVMIIQWTTWERQEWQDENGTYFQVNASGIDDVPDSMKQRYQDFVINVDWKTCTRTWHERIWEFHQYLDSLGVKHVFINGNTDFSSIKKQMDWGTSYIGPYDPKMTFSALLQSNGFQTVSPNSYHFGKEAHSFFSHFMLKYCIENHFV